MWVQMIIQNRKDGKHQHMNENVKLVAGLEEERRATCEEELPETTRILQMSYFVS